MNQKTKLVEKRKTWLDRTKLAEKTGWFRHIDIKLASKLKTGPILEHPKLKGIKYQLSDLTDDMNHLGYVFYYHVQGNDYKMAEKTRQEIMRKRKVLKK